MKLERLTLKNLLGLRDQTLHFAAKTGQAPRDVTLITGAPQAGKTAVLRAIAAAKEAVGAYGAASHPMKLTRPGPDASIDATWHLSAAEQRETGESQSVRVAWELSSGDLPEVGPRLRTLFAAFSLRAERSKGVLVGARRTLDTSAENPLLPRLPDAQIGRSVLRDDGAQYEGLLRAFHELALRQAVETNSLLHDRGVAFQSQVRSGLAGYAAAVAVMCPSLRLVAVEPQERTRPLVWFQTSGGARVELAQVSDGELHAVLFAFVFVWLGLRSSLVLIDTPELLVHPADHLRFFRAICELGTDNQIIAATTSPAILGSVAPEQIIDLSKPETGATTR